MVKLPVAIEPTPDTAAPPPAAEPANSFLQIGFPERVTPFVRLAIQVGAALILLSIGLAMFNPFSAAANNLLLSSGMAILLAAFGGQANYRSSGVIIAGAAAIAAIFFTYMEYSRRSDVPTFVRGYIANVEDGKSLVEIERRSHFLGRFPVGQNQYEFVAFKRDMDQVNDSQDVVVEIADKSQPDSKDVFNVPFKCLAQWMGSGKDIGWYYDKSKGTLREFNASGRHIAERKGEEGSSTITISTCSGPTVLSSAVGMERIYPSSGLFTTSALAGDAGVITPTSDIAKLLIALQDDDSDARRVARSSLSLVQPQNVRLLLQHAHGNRGNERVELGISVALTEMLRRDKSIRQQILITDSDIEMLLDFATSRDRTLRIYAGEFLYDLGRPQVTKLALRRLKNRLPSTSPEADNALYNLLFVAQDGWSGLTAAEKTELQSYLDGIEDQLATKPKSQSLRRQLR